MLFLLSLASAADDIACAELTGPPKGARALVASELPALRAYRERLLRGKMPEAPLEAGVVARFLAGSAAPDTLTGRASTVGQDGAWLVTEVAAPRRTALVEANVTAVVDISDSMSAVPTRRYPLLQDEPPGAYRPVDRLQLAKRSLDAMIDALPEGSQLALVAIDGNKGRVITPATTDRREMRLGIDRLRFGMLGPQDGRTQDVLEQAGSSTFVRCADNRAFVLTDDTVAAAQRQAIDVVEQWSSEDAQVWSLAIGSRQPIDPEAAALGQGDNIGGWFIDAPSDAERFFDIVFDPGGTMARQVSWSDARLGPARDMGSGDTHVGVHSAPSSSLSLRSDSGVEPVTIGRDAPWARLQLAGARWSGGEGVDVPFGYGPAAELAAWAQLEAPARSEAEVVVLRSWLDEGRWMIDVWAPDAKPEDFTSGGAPPTASVPLPEGWRLLFDAQATLSFDGRALVLPALVDGPRAAVLTLVDATGDPQRAFELLQPHAEAHPDDPWVAHRATVLLRELGRLSEAATWAERCDDAFDPERAVDCSLVLARHAEIEGRIEEAATRFGKAIETYPRSAQAWAEGGRFAFGQKDDELAEERLIEALGYGAPSHPTATLLADVAEARHEHGLAAIALSRAFLVQPEDQALRQRFLGLIERGWKRLPKSQGLLGRIRPLRNGTSPERLSILMNQWVQAIRRWPAISTQPDGWQTEVGQHLRHLEGFGDLPAAVVLLANPPSDDPRYLDALRRVDRAMIEMDLKPSTR